MTCKLYQTQYQNWKQVLAWNALCVPSAFWFLQTKIITWWCLTQQHQKLSGEQTFWFENQLKIINRIKTSGATRNPRFHWTRLERIESGQGSGHVSENIFVSSWVRDQGIRFWSENIFPRYHIFCPRISDKSEITMITEWKPHALCPAL